jgi:hypothetical protein
MSARASGNGNDKRGLDLTIWGISDPEILGIVDDSADEEGWSPTLEVRLRLGEDIESGRRSGVPTRLSWLRRYGWLEQHPDDRSRWRLTPLGQELLDHPDLTATVTKALDRLNPAQRLRVTREIAELGGSSAYRTALRRQWTRSLGR